MEEYFRQDKGRGPERRDSWVHRGQVLDLIDAQPCHGGPGGAYKALGELEGQIAGLQHPVPEGHVLVHVLVTRDQLDVWRRVAKRITDRKMGAALGWILEHGDLAYAREMAARRFLADLLSTTVTEVEEMMRAGGPELRGVDVARKMGMTL